MASKRVNIFVPIELLARIKTKAKEADTDVSKYMVGCMEHDLKRQEVQRRANTKLLVCTFDEDGKISHQHELVFFD
jgi:hypothetical protein